MLRIPWTIWSLPPKTFQKTNRWQYFRVGITINHRVFQKKLYRFTRKFNFESKMLLKYQKVRKMLWTPWTIWSLPPKTFQITNCRLHFGDCITISHRVFRKTAFKMFKIFGHFPLFFIKRVNYLISIPCNLIWSTSLIAYLCWNHNKSPIHPKYINVENSKCC